MIKENVKRMVCGLALVLALLTPAARAGDAETAKTRFAHLTRGINVGWLNNGKFALDAERATAEAKIIAQTGCNHVRLYLNVDALRSAEDRALPDAAKLPTLDAAIKIANGAGLAVIVDTFHYSHQGLIKFPGPQDPEAAAMAKFWGALAKHLAATDPERVFLEVANEPGVDEAKDWYAVEMGCLKAMRAGAPRHTLIAGYNMKVDKKTWNGLKALTLFPPVEDKNIIYNFHDYNPMAMTHQGASWSKGANKLLRGVPYPSSPEAIAPLVEKFADPAAKKMLQKYGEDRWNREKMEKELSVVADWAKARGVMVTCNEFGVLRNVAPPEARAAWTRDMRLSLEKLGIGWTIWDGSFSFLERDRRSGQFKVDPKIIEALGLKMP